jgi:4'-phosphopantetheinyl transferase
VRFNLARSHELALVAVALGVDVGVDIERVRPLPEYAAIAERFFPPSEREDLDERDFFRRWTRIEAKLKARGVGLYGAGAELGGEWTVEPIDAGEGFAAAVAVERAGMRVVVVRELRNEANSSTRSREDAEKNAEKNWEK